MNSFQIILTSDSCLDIFSKNTLSTFTVLLPESIKFRSPDEWKVGIKQIIMAPTKPPTTSSQTANTKDGEKESPIYVYLDIVENIVVGDGMSKVALVLPPPFLESYHHFENVSYRSLSKNDIRTITVSLKDKFGNKYPFESSHVSTVCVLEFKHSSFDY